MAGRGVEGGKDRNCAWGFVTRGLDITCTYVCRCVVDSSSSSASPMALMRCCCRSGAASLAVGCRWGLQVPKRRSKQKKKNLLYTEIGDDEIRLLDLRCGQRSPPPPHFVFSNFQQGWRACIKNWRRFLSPMQVSFIQVVQIYSTAAEATTTRLI